MLRITTQDDTGSTTLKLAGRLTGPWVTELERCWRAVLGSEPGRSLRLDLTDVTFIDAAGKQLLGLMIRQQTRLEGVGLLVQSIIEEIMRLQGEQT